MTYCAPPQQGQSCSRESITMVIRALVTGAVYPGVVTKRCSCGGKIRNADRVLVDRSEGDSPVWKTRA